MDSILQGQRDLLLLRLASLSCLRIKHIVTDMPAKLDTGLVASDTQQPAWARCLHRRQQFCHVASTVAHTLRGGSGNIRSPNLSDPSDSYEEHLMRFKRSLMHYAGTPRPATPYESAEQVWNDRIGSARVQAKKWRLTAFGCLVLALLMTGGLVWRPAVQWWRIASYQRNQ